MLASHTTLEHLPCERGDNRRVYPTSRKKSEQIRVGTESLRSSISVAKEHVSCQALPEHFKNKNITRALLLARGTLCITPVEMLSAFLPQINTLLKTQSGKGRQPGKATTGTCNPPSPVTCVVLDALRLISN